MIGIGKRRIGFPFSRSRFLSNQKCKKRPPGGGDLYRSSRRETNTVHNYNNPYEEVNIIE